MRHSRYIDEDFPDIHWRKALIYICTRDTVDGASMKARRCNARPFHSMLPLLLSRRQIARSTSIASNFVLISSNYN